MGKFTALTALALVGLGFLLAGKVLPEGFSTPPVRLGVPAYLPEPVPAAADLRPPVRLGRPAVAAEAVVLTSVSVPAPTAAPCPPAPAIPREAPAAPANSWARADLGPWWVRSSRLPPLVTTSPAGTPVASAGVLGTPGAAVVIGDDRVNGDARPGGRIALGTWLDDAQLWGVEGTFLAIGSRRSTAVAGSDGSVILARPFIDAATGAEAAELVSYPGVLAGSATVDAQAGALYGAEALLRAVLLQRCDSRVELIAGYRHLRFEESLEVREALTSLVPASLGTSIGVLDRFAADNTFHGGQLGLQAGMTRGPLALDVLGKLALGNVRRQADVAGATLVTSPGFAPVLSPGGLLALPNNSGQFASDRFALVPELGLLAGWQLRPGLRANLGYTLLWWPDVVRATELTDRTVDTSLLPPAVPGPVRPGLLLRDSDLWVHGLNLGMEVRY